MLRLCTLPIRVTTLTLPDGSIFGGTWRSHAQVPPHLAMVEEMLDLVLAERPRALLATAAGPVKPLLHLDGVACVRDQLRLQGRLRALVRLVRA